MAEVLPTATTTEKVNNDLGIKVKISKHFLENKNVNAIKSNLSKHDFDDILSNLCFSLDSGDILIDYRYFKFISTPNNHQAIIYYITSVIKTSLLSHNTFTIHVNMESLSLLHIEKYFDFIKNVSQVLKSSFPDKLNICYIYNAPYIFYKIISIISIFIDKKTQQKIKLVKDD